LIVRSDQPTNVSWRSSLSLTRNGGFTTDAGGQPAKPY
jgi:hypothetical protein